MSRSQWQEYALKGCHFTVDMEIGEILHIFPSGTESMGDRGSKMAYTGPRTGIYLPTKFGSDRSIVVGCRSWNDRQTSRQTDKQNGMTIRLSLRMWRNSQLMKLKISQWFSQLLSLSHLSSTRKHLQQEFCSTLCSLHLCFNCISSISLRDKQHGFYGPRLPLCLPNEQR